jgi:phage terminase small subunit
MSKEKALTEQQKQFAHEYIIDLNATNAAVRAGYKKTTAGSQGSRLLKDRRVSQLISELKSKRAEETQSDAHRVVEELKSLAFSNIKDVASWDDKGHLSVKSSDEIPTHIAAAIESIKMDRHVLSVKTTRDDDEGEETKEEEYKAVITVKFHKKAPAIFLLMRHLGMLDDKEIDENPVLKRALDDLKRGR